MFQSLLTKIFFEFIIIITIKINKQEFNHWVSINDHTNILSNYKLLCMRIVLIVYLGWFLFSSFRDNNNASVCACCHDHHGKPENEIY